METAGACSGVSHKSKTIKKRKPNFTVQEQAFLRVNYEKNKEVLREKLSNSTTNIVKQRVWKRIADGLNSLGTSNHRTPGEVKRKWTNMQSEAKSVWGKYKRERGKTGGGPPPSEIPEEKMKIIEMFQDDAGFNGLQGIESESKTIKSLI